MTTQIPNYINGRRVVGRSARTAPVFNPATGEQTGELGLASTIEVNEAIAAANKAAPAWADTSPLRRSRILNRFLRIAEDRIDQLAAVITSEHGKILSDAKGEVQRGLEVVEFAVGAPNLMKGEISENVGSRRTATVSANRSASSPASRRSISPRWCRCGCFRSRLLAEIPSF
jgi:malonate-semialdehyde dehydrogenase (acetylating)/methylmalonate-semialdehyde dehydrogenase